MTRQHGTFSPVRKIYGDLNHYNDANYFHNSLMAVAAPVAVAPYLLSEIALNELK